MAEVSVNYRMQVYLYSVISLLCALMPGMFKPLPLYIGLRYVRARRRTHFISFITLSSILGLTLSIAVLIAVLAVINGFERELEERILGMVPHARLYAAQPVSDWQSVAGEAINDAQVVAVAPFIELQGMLATTTLVKPVFVSGVEPEYEKHVSIIDDFFVEGSLASLERDDFGMLMDEALAEELGLKVGDKITLVLPEASISPLGLLPRFKRFTLRATFSVGADVGSYMVLINIHDAGKILRLKGKVHGVRLKLDDLFRAPEVAWRLSRSLVGNFYASNWTQSHGSLYQAIKMQKGMITLLLLLLVAVAVFNIIASLVMLVNDKKPDIAILRTLGVSSRGIMGIFIVQGLFIGLIGCTLGALLGVLLALSLEDLYGWLENTFQLNLLDSYFVHYLPTELRVNDVLMVVMISFLLTACATLYPAWRASNTEPADELRHE